MEELIVDNFAGGGGASTGIETAMGRPIDIAINHDPIAVAMHKMNHPDTFHYCESVWDVDPVKACAGRQVGLAWFSPDCTHFSKAKGNKPVKKQIRGLAWVVLKWAVKVRPRVIMLENVEEFVTWGPLIKKENGDHYPCPDRKGQTFKAFINALKRQGYAVEKRELRACDYGSPTIRKRLFIIARCDGEAITWPQPTHGDPETEAVKSGRLDPWHTAAECIDWSHPCPSIFERQRPLVEATMRRIAKGIMRYVVNEPNPFIVTYYGDKNGEFRGQPMDEPLRTQTTENRHALVTPFIGECANSTKRNMPIDGPLRTICANPKGGHFTLVSAFLAQHNGGFYKGAGRPADKPLSTIVHRGTQQQIVAAHIVRNMGQSVGSHPKEPARTATRIIKDGIVSSHLVKLRGTCRDGQPVTKPMPTITAGGLHVGEVRAFLMKYYGTNQHPKLREPMHTVTVKDRFGLVTVHGEEYQITDIGMRMLQPRELFRAQGFPDSYIIEQDENGKPFTKTAQVAKCGNSVPPQLSEALVRANVVDQTLKTAGVC